MYRRMRLLTGYENHRFYWNSASCAPVPSCCGYQHGAKRPGRRFKQHLLYMVGRTQGPNSSRYQWRSDRDSARGQAEIVDADNVIVARTTRGFKAWTAFYGGPPVTYNLIIESTVASVYNSLSDLVHGQSQRRCWASIL